MAHRVVTVPILEDNYSYLVVCTETNQAACVDPADAKAVFEAAQREGVQLTHVLTTHMHWDHAGGNNEMKALVPGIQVIGGKGDNAQGVMREVGDGDSIEVGKLKFSVLFTPCHTPGHVTFVLDSASPKCCFTGDTLFVAGCGNFNAGTPQQMYSALVEKIGSLPPSTLAYVGHEYTEKNFMFALHADPGNEAARAKMEWVRAQRSKGLPTVPTTIEDELKTNPFVRCREEALQAFTGKKNAVDCLAELRRLKSAWKPVSL